MNTHKFVFSICLILTLLMAIFWFASWVAVGIAQGNAHQTPTDQIIIQFENTAVTAHLLKPDLVDKRVGARLHLNTSSAGY